MARLWGDGEAVGFAGNSGKLARADGSESRASWKPRSNYLRATRLFLEVNSLIFRRQSGERLLTDLLLQLSAS